MSWQMLIYANPFVASSSLKYQIGDINMLFQKNGIVSFPIYYKQLDKAFLNE